MRRTNDAGIADLMAKMGRRGREAAGVLAVAPTEAKNAALLAAADAVEAEEAAILEANAADLDAGADLSDSFRDRLRLTPERLQGIAAGLRDVAALPDPVGRTLARWTRPNGLDIARVATPLGVVGVIYESRPNVTADAGGLCLKSGNAVILRGGSDSARSSAALHACLARGLAAAGLPETAIQNVPITDRAAVGAMLEGLGGAIDVLVPRGGKSLVARVQAEARVAVIGHLDGVCHVYVDASAETKMAREIAVDAKMRRTGVCGAAETLLFDRAGADAHLVPVLTAIHEAGCEIRGDADVLARFPEAVPAAAEDWDAEYLAPVIAVALVDGVEGAIAHIARHGSGHTESIVAGDQVAAERFLAGVDSAIVLHNASTHFADGGEFGMGAEIGIATSKLHARGPVGLEQLCSFKYVVRGAGQTRG